MYPQRPFKKKVVNFHGGCKGPEMQITRILGSLIAVDKIENFTEINKEILPVIENEVVATNIAVQDTAAFTSDKVDISEINDNLHTNEKFKKLFFEIEKCLGIFFGNLKYKDSDAFITKSWATYSEKNQFISTHEHVASVYSFVYYVQMNKDHSPLTFYEPQQKRFYMPDSTEWNDANHQTVSIMGEPGMLIVFPSHVFHGTEKKNTTDIPRVSISGDIIITAKPGVVTEHLLPHPTTWRAI